MDDTEQQHYNDDLDLNRMGGAFSPPTNDHASSILKLTNPEEDLYKFELFLRSLKSTPGGDLIKIGEPLLNEKGINSVMAGIESVVHQCNALSNFTEEDIIYMHDTLKDNIILDLMINALSYELDRRNRDLIVGNSLRFAYGFVLRAKNEGDRKFWKGTTQEIKHTTEQKRTGGGSALNPFNMFGKK